MKIKATDVVWALATLGYYNYQSSQSTRAKMKEELRIRNGGRQTDLEFLVQALQQVVKTCTLCLGVLTLWSFGKKVAQGAKEFSRGEGRPYQEWITLSEGLMAKKKKEEEE